MHIRIDSKDKSPLHVKVERMMRELIQQPAYQNGDFLPKEVDIAEKLDVARNTVRHAIGKLVNEGLLIRKKGVGTIVAPHRIPTRLDSWWSFTKEMKAKGIEVVNYELSSQIVAINEEVSLAFNIKEGGKIVQVTRLRGTPEGPSLLTISWFHPRLKLSCNENFNKPLYQMLEEDFGTIASVSREELGAITADEYLAEKFNVAIGAPILFRKRIVSDTNGQLMEFNKVYYKGEGFTYTIDIARQ